MKDKRELLNNEINRNDSEKWRIAYLGTFHPAVPTLKSLAEKKWIKLVVLLQDVGNKNEELLKIIHQYDLKISYDIKAIDECDINLILAANYPKLVPTRYIHQYPCINTHWSPLPRYCGMHGTAWGLINGDDELAVSIHWMEKEFDTGDIIAQKTIKVMPEMNIVELHKQLAKLQAQMVIQLLNGYDNVCDFPRRLQNLSLATYVPQRVPEDGIIDWSWSTKRIWNLIRALPKPYYPGAFTFYQDRKLIIWEAEPANTPEYFSTFGQVVRVIKGTGVWIKTGDSCLFVKDVQFENEDPCNADEILKRGDKLGLNSQAELQHLRWRVKALEASL
ncbi:hypothetical protein K8T06_03700 [bacterium]|nr:hypothetical protein [bacterium]